MVKEKIESAIASTQSILSRSSLSSNEKDAIIGMMSRMAYYWCAERATEKAMNDYFKELYPEEYKTFLATYRRSKTYADSYKKGMECWPYDERY